MLHDRRAVLSLLGFMSLAAACQGLPPEGPEAQSAALEGQMLEIDFTAKPTYLEKNVIVLTFDDGPDTNYTPKVLDILKEKDVKATFFINTINQTNVDSQAVAQNLVRRIVAEGHELATHTVHHIDLAVQTEAKIEEEIVGVENSVKKIFGDNGPRMTLLRSPFGRPYQNAAGSAAYKKVSAVVAKHAVHIGWAIDSNDWMYQGNAERVYSNVTGLIKKPGEGAYGVILMHSINPQTVGALPRIIDYIKSNGFVLKLTEDVVRARFGMSSAQLLGVAPVGGSGGGGAGGAGSSANPDAGGGPSSPASDADPIVPVDAGPSSGGTGGSAGGSSGGAAPGGGSGQGSNGTGGSASGPVGNPSLAPSGDSSGCSYPGSRPSPMIFAFALAGVALLLRRRR